MVEIPHNPREGSDPEHMYCCGTTCDSVKVAKTHDRQLNVIKAQQEYIKQLEAYIKQLEYNYDQATQAPAQGAEGHTG